MSHLLYRLGRSAATRPWVAICAWVVLALVVIASSVAVGRELEESFEAPGLDSHQAAELLAGARADVAMVVLLIAFGSLVAMGCRSGWRCSAWSLASPR